MMTAVVAAVKEAAVAGYVQTALKVAQMVLATTSEYSSSPLYCVALLSRAFRRGYPTSRSASSLRLRPVGRKRDSPCCCYPVLSGPTAERLLTSDSSATATLPVTAPPPPPLLPSAPSQHR